MSCSSCSLPRSHPDLPVGQVLDAIQRIRAETTQSFGRAFAQKRGEETARPVKPPRSIATAAPSAFEQGGTIDIAGSPAPGDTISVSIGNPASESAFIQLPLFVVGSPNLETTAAGLRDWLNGTEQFAAVSTDGGATWASILPEGNDNKIVLPVGQLEAAGTAFAVSTFLIDHKLRVDVAEASGADYESYLSGSWACG